jgi:hypothetical protein
MKNIVSITLGLLAVQALGGDVAEYVDPRIGNISKLLVPTFPTFHLPNQMVRMVPGRHEYRDDQIMQGGTLEYVLGKHPNKSWGK